jgi:FAD/FMN-containing dehydrogenase
VTLPGSLLTPLAGWGNFPVEESVAYRPERIDQLASIVASAPEPSLIGRGHGRSYGDASLNAGGAVVLHEHLNRFLAFDAEQGIVHCEAAVSLSEIIDHFLPRGFFMPVTPGTKHISIGGAIAADVHGKNHHRDGTISAQLVDFGLLTARGEVLRCSREENSEVFWATIGGMGLTGLILDAHLRLRRVDTAYVHGLTELAPNLDTALERIVESDREHAYAVAWIDCLARGRAMGRSVLLRANPARLDELPPDARRAPLSISAPSWMTVPFDLPGFLLNRHSMRAFNTAFWLAHSAGEAIANYQRYFYPLDAVLHWNRVYGKRGCLQYQVVLPTANARAALIDMLERITAKGWGSFLAVLKSMGPSNEGLLSFPREGLTLSLDFPYYGPELLELLQTLDEIALRHGGRIYLAKDACLQREHFQEMYPNLQSFREIKAKLDPEQRFSSSLARRLGIVEAA